MATAADKIQAQVTRQAYADGVKDFAKHFGHVAAALVVGAVLGLFIAFVAWLFYFASTSNWAVLVSPAFQFGAAFVAFSGIGFILRLVRRRR